jgi:hypothetical protein
MNHIITQKQTNSHGEVFVSRRCKLKSVAFFGQDGKVYAPDFTVRVDGRPIAIGDEIEAGSGIHVEMRGAPSPTSDLELLPHAPVLTFVVDDEPSEQVPGLLPGVSDETLLKLLVQRLHGNLSFTNEDLKRAEQLHLERTWDGHRFTLKCAWP